MAGNTLTAANCSDRTTAFDSLLSRILGLCRLGMAVLILLIPEFLSISAMADGPADNIPDQVRRIPERGVEVPADREAAMRSSLTELQEKLARLHAADDPVSKSLIPDVMIFERAVRCALDYQEFFDVREFDKADALLTEGIQRADQLLAGDPAWVTQKGLVVRGYISRIDNTVQPYGLVVPSTYAAYRSVPTRCDIWFHGRGEKLSEVNFLWDRMKNPGEFAPEHVIVLHPYGRYCNAFKFAGEIDVLESLADVQQRYRIDDDRISVRGFSMGGAACWQFATHYSDRWFAAAPGAGFSETPQFLKVFQKEELRPASWEQTLWNLYDCDKWSLNLIHCPTIAYSGENDSQKQAADVMQAALAEHGIRLNHVIGKGMGHKYDPDSRKIITDAMSQLALKGRNRTPRHVYLQTYSLRYNRQHWLTVNQLKQHWKAARVEAHLSPGPLMIDDTGRSINPVVANVFISTANVTDLSLDLPPGSLNDFLGGSVSVHVRPHRSESASAPAAGKTFVTTGRVFSDGSYRVRISIDPDGHWKVTPDSETSTEQVLLKRHKLQGPVDDAFMDSFIFVRPGGTAANELVGQWADAELDRAIEHWRRHFRGDARVVNDLDLTDEMIRSANIVLWGDPGSNRVLGRIADRLPIRWTADTITVGSQSFDAQHHAPILICPNPLNPERYVVLNSSFTFRDYAYLNNARQVPMLPDWAIIDLTTPPNAIRPGRVAGADFFDEHWKIRMPQ